MHQSSLDKMHDFRSAYLTGQEHLPLHIVDLGSQDVNGTYRPLFDGEAWTYTGIDMCAGKNVDIALANPYHWRELRSASVDVLISGQAFEHIEFFWLTMLEIARVLKPNGLCCIIVPSGGFEHRYPVDCWRFYPDGLQALARFVRLDVLATYTQWEDGDYVDGSDVWHDSVLICRKPVCTPWVSFKRRLKRFVQHRVLTIRL